MTLSITTSFNRGVQRCPWTDWKPTSFVVHDTVGGTSIDRGFVDSSGNGVAGAFGNGGYTVAGDKDFPMDIPTGGPYYAAIQPSGNPGARVTGSTPIVVGDVTLAIGQSCMGQWITNTGTYSPAANTALLYQEVFQTPSGDGIVSYLNALASLSGVPQIMIMAAVGGTALTKDGYNNYFAAGSNQAGFWTARNENGSSGLWDGTHGLDKQVGVGGVMPGQFIRVLWDQGESDSLNVRPEVYCRALRKLWMDLKALCLYPEHLSMGIIETGDYQPSSPSGNKSYPINLAQRKFAADLAPAVFIAGQRYDLPRSDGVHPSPAACAELASKRVAPLIARMDYFV